MSTTDVASSRARTGDLRTRGPRTSSIWVAICVILPAVASLGARIGTIDLAYQLRLGGLVWRHASIPRFDAFTFTANGRAWTDQQWLAQAVLWPVWRVGGWPALVLLRSALIGLTFTLVFLACRAAGARRTPSALLALASFGACMLGLALRPQLIAFALFAAVAWLVASRDAHPRRLWLLPGLVAIWSNVHGSFFLGPVMIGLAALEPRDAVDRRSLVRVGVVSAAASLANPSGAGVFGYVLSIATNPAIGRGVTEWAPPSISDAAGAAFFASVAALLVWFARSSRRLSWPTIVTLGVFFVLGLQSGRGTFWWDLLVPVVVARILASETVHREEPDPRVTPVMAAVVALAIGATAFAFLPTRRASSDTVSNAPIRLTQALRTILRPEEPVFAPQTWSSWFELELPRHGVFVDSRIELFPEAVWRDYFDVSEARDGWRRILDRWGVRVVVADPDRQPALVRAIRSSDGWSVAYDDLDGGIFVRDAAVASAGA
jgi:hypothetical protein